MTPIQASVCVCVSIINKLVCTVQYKHTTDILLMYIKKETLQDQNDLYFC